MQTFVELEQAQIEARAKLLLAALEAEDWFVARAARRLAISQSRIRHLIAKHGLESAVRAHLQRRGNPAMHRKAAR